MPLYRPSERMLIEGTVSALFFGVLAGWRIGLSILFLFALSAYALRNIR